MSVRRYEPWGFLPQIQDEINRVFSAWQDNESSGATAGWVPPVDINEYRDRFVLFVDLPGVEPDAVNITLENGVLTLSGARAETTGASEGEESVERRIERGRGQFHRRFILPDTVDADRVEATNRNGVLMVQIPKKAKAQPRRIEVSS